MHTITLEEHFTTVEFLRSNGTGHSQANDDRQGLTDKLLDIGEGV